MARDPKNGDRTTCPRCKESTFVYYRRYPVVSQESKYERLRYEAGWVCENGRCEYRRLKPLAMRD